MHNKKHRVNKGLNFIHSPETKLEKGASDRNSRTGSSRFWNGARVSFRPYSAFQNFNLIGTWLGGFIRVGLGLI